MKKVLALLVSVFLLLAMIPMTATSVSAAGKTKDEALQWLSDSEGQTRGNGQCVGLTMEYYRFLGVPVYTGNANTYSFPEAVPASSGWQSIPGALPQAGDIMVWTGGVYGWGHVAICGEPGKYYHQNWLGHPYVEVIDKAYTDGIPAAPGIPACLYWGVIRPNFNNPTITCTITYDANGGNLNSVPPSQIYTYATTGTTTLSANMPTRSGYTFLGWSLSENASSPSYTAGQGWSLSNLGDYVLYAVWDKNSYSVRIDPDGGEIDGSTATVFKDYPYGSKITLPTPVRKGYDFVCWTIDYSGGDHILEPWGQPLHQDPSFSYSLSDIHVYNNLQNGNVAIEAVNRASDCPTSSANMLRLTTTGKASPDLGGYYQLTYSKKSGVFYHVIIAKIPVGYRIERGSNSCGEGATSTWLTSQDGTDQFETYIYKTICGSSGIFDSFGHVYITGAEATQTSPLVWYVGYSEVFDGTGVYNGSEYTVGSGVGFLRAMWKKQHEHTYANACDADCNVCGAIREVGNHIYDNDCDTACNACGETRNITHRYSDATCTAPMTCSVCGATSGLALGHKYDNACDASCSICGAVRTPAAHVYSNDCDDTCNVCGTVRTVGEHSYNGKITTAATCGADGVMTYVCSSCGHSYTETILATGVHVYDDEYDANCNACGEEREVPEKPIIPDLPADAPAFVVESATAREGEEFTIAIRTQRNSGIVSMKLGVSYDADVLELISLEEQDFANVVFSPLTKNPFMVNWADALNPNNTIDGVVALVTFRVKEGAPLGKTEITLTYDPEDVYDENYDNVAFRVENGSVDIVDYIPGDVNADGRVNNKDLGLLQRYLSGWDVQVAEKAGDVNADGRVNNKDLGLFQQYLSGWDVELG